MPLCPRCGAAHHHQDEVCRECGKRLRNASEIEQEALEFPTCVDGPEGCEGPAIERPDGRLRCSAHHLNSHLTVQRIPDPTPLACADGPEGCHGPVTPRVDDQLRCDHHQELLELPRWRTLLKRWFGRL